jgi:hypothetical protein
MFDVIFFINKKKKKKKKASSHVKDHAIPIEIFNHLFHGGKFEDETI